jgi:hypothetical protein
MSLNGGWRWRIFKKIYPQPRVIIHMYINSIKEMNFTGLADCR